MDISSYISELLFEHDCVIIPNFGGFICNYKPADIHPIQNTVSPPAKAIYVPTRSPTGNLSRIKTKSPLGKTEGAFVF